MFSHTLQARSSKAVSAVIGSLGACYALFGGLKAAPELQIRRKVRGLFSAFRIQVLKMNHDAVLCV